MNSREGKPANTCQSRWGRKTIRAAPAASQGPRSVSNRRRLVHSRPISSPRIRMPMEYLLSSPRPSRPPKSSQRRVASRRSRVFNARSRTSSAAAQQPDRQRRVLHVTQGGIFGAYQVVELVAEVAVGRRDEEMNQQLGQGQIEQEGLGPGPAAAPGAGP